MKKTILSLLCLLLPLCMMLCLAACGNSVKTEGLWENAVYQEDASFVDGQKEVTVEVKAGEKSVTLTIYTDAEFLGEALLSHNLIDGEMGQFGMYIKSANGIIADYDEDQSYWGFFKNGEYMMTGVDATKITDGEHYELVYTK